MLKLKNIFIESNQIKEREREREREKIITELVVVQSVIEWKYRRMLVFYDVLL